MSKHPSAFALDKIVEHDGVQSYVTEIKFHHPGSKCYKCAQAISVGDWGFWAPLFKAHWHKECFAP